MARVSTVYASTGAVDQVARYIKDEFFNTFAPVHKVYLTQFNAVDKGDRIYSEASDKHRVCSWHIVMTHAIQRLGLVDVWTMDVQQYYQH